MLVLAGRIECGVTKPTGRSSRILRPGIDHLHRAAPGDVIWRCPNKSTCRDKLFGKVRQPSVDKE